MDQGIIPKGHVGVAEIDVAVQRGVIGDDPGRILDKGGLACRVHLITC
jgi:hypothetical protein